MKRLVIVADNPLIVGAIHSGVRNSGAFECLGYADPRRASAASIVQAGAEIVLVDEADGSEPAISMIRGIKEHNDAIHVIVLAVRLEGEWLARAFEAGANGAMSKSIHPPALATLVRAAVSGHIVHSATMMRSVSPAPRESATDHSSLTEREREILQWVASGATNSEIARQLWITQQTVKFHVSNIYRKLDVANRTEACHYAHLNRLVFESDSTSAAGGSGDLLAVAAA